MPSYDGIDATEALRGAYEREERLFLLGDHPDGREPFERALQAFTGPSSLMCVNKAGRGEPRWEWCATLESFTCCAYEPWPPGSLDDRTYVIGLATGCESKRVNETLLAEPYQGTSGCFAVAVAVWLGYRDIHVFGIECEPGTIWGGGNVQATWREWAPVFRENGVVINANGWLADLL